MTKRNEMERKTDKTRGKQENKIKNERNEDRRKRKRFQSGSLARKRSILIMELPFRKQP